MNNWTNFWKNEYFTPESITELNVDTFIKSTNSILDFNSQDVIMDIGCGDSQLASKLKDKVKEIHCLDICKRNLIESRKKFEQDKNVYFHLLDDTNYTDLSVINRNIKFTKIICLSVIQYYEKKNELEKLLIEIKRLAAPGAKLFIADIPTTKLSYLDIFFFFRSAFKNNIFLPAIITIYKARFSNYYTLNKKVGLQYYSIEYLEDLIMKHNLKARIFTTQMTLNKRRIHLLVNF